MKTIDMSIDQELEREKFEVDRDLRTRDLGLREREFNLKEGEASRSRWSNPIVIAVIGATIAALGNIGAIIFTGKQQRELEDRRFTNENALETRKAEGSRVLAAINTSGDPDKAATNLKFLVDTTLIADDDLRGKISRYLATRPKGTGVATSNADSVGRATESAGLLKCVIHKPLNVPQVEAAITTSMNAAPFGAVTTWHNSDDGEHGLSSAIDRQEAAQEQVHVEFRLFSHEGDTNLEAVLTARSESYMSLMPTGNTKGTIVSRNVWFQYMKPLQDTLEGTIKGLGSDGRCSPGASAD